MLVKTAFVLTTLLVASVALAESWSIDPVHSVALYKIKHFDAGLNYGRFNDISGKINFDRKAPEKGSVEITIRADSVDTNNAKRDDHLKSPDFFAAKQHPLITFKSKKVERKNGTDNVFLVTGDLTLLGQTKPLTVEVENTGIGKDPKGNEVLGFHLEHKLKRSDFGMNFMLGPIADETTIIVSLEARKS